MITIINTGFYNTYILKWVNLRETLCIHAIKKKRFQKNKRDVNLTRENVSYFTRTGLVSRARRVIITCIYCKIVFNDKFVFGLVFLDTAEKRACFILHSYQLSSHSCCCRRCVHLIHSTVHPPPIGDGKIADRDNSFF